MSKECKAAGGAQDNMFLTASDDEENDEEDGEAEEVDDKLTLLREEMEVLEHQMYVTGTMASVFARTITQCRPTNKTLGAEVIAAMEDIFKGNENPDPGGLPCRREFGGGFHPVASPSANGPGDTARRPNRQPDSGI